MINRGFIAPKFENDHYVLGAIGQSLPREIIRPDKQWDSGLPKVEFQRNEFIDTTNCTGYASLNNWEILAKVKYGLEFDWCERDLGIQAGTYPPGNDPHVVAETARKEGLIADTVLPFDSKIDTIDKYYSYPNDKKEDECRVVRSLFKTRYSLGHEWVFKGDYTIEEQRYKMLESLQYSTLGVAVYAWSFNGEKYERKGEDTHWTVIYGFYENGDWKCYDSYDNTLKRLDKDFGFTYVKRYSIDKIEDKTKQKKRTFWDFIKSLFNL
jgi:hypothetical protein